MECDDDNAHERASVLRDHQTNGGEIDNGPNACDTTEPVKRRSVEKRAGPRSKKQKTQV